MRQFPFLFIPCTAALLVLLGVGPAWAQRSASNKAAAEALFDEALNLMKEKQYAEACPKLEESQRIDAGIGTLLYLAECYEKSGRTASAWATFREAASAASAAGQNERALQGKERADKLEDQLSKLTIVVAPENLSIEGFQVTRGGQAVPAPLFDTAVPVDPGDLLIEASAPGYQPLSKTVFVAADGARAVVEIPALVAAAPAPEAVPADATTGEAALDSQAADDMSTTSDSSNMTADTGTDPGRGMRTAGVVLMGVGALGLVIGSVYGIHAINKDRDADDFCGPEVCRNQQGADLSSEAQSAATISTVSFAVGGAALVGGALVYVFAPKASQTGTLGVGPLPGGAHMSYQGRF